MVRFRLLLFVSLLGLALLAVACESVGSDVHPEASRQVLLLAAEGSTIASAQLAPGGLGSADSWCIVTGSEAGQERWVVIRTVTEGERDTYSLTVPGDRSGFERLGCTNWDG